MKTDDTMTKQKKNDEKTNNRLQNVTFETKHKLHQLQRRLSGTLEERGETA